VGFGKFNSCHKPWFAILLSTVRKGVTRCRLVCFVCEVEFASCFLVVVGVRVLFWGLVYLLVVVGCCFSSYLLLVVM
jgi:hypothetical protein